MMRRLVLTALTGASLALAACSPQDATPSSTPTGTPTGEATAASSMPVASASTTTPAGGDQASPSPSASTPVDQLINTQSVISYEGIGAYSLGTPGATLQRQGLATPNQGCEKMWDPTKTPQVLGIELNFDGDTKLIGVSTMNPMMKTTSGAHAGMTFAQVAKIYGKGFSYVSLPTGEQGKLAVGRISHGSREILFGHRADNGQDSDAAPEIEVSWVMVQEQSKGIFWGC